MGFVNPSCINEPLLIDTLHDYASEVLNTANVIIDGAFHFIVDTGCSLSASPHKEDFETLEPLPRPVTLCGIAGNSTVTHGGLLCFQCINTRGELVTIKMFGYYNPHMSVCLFSPQAYFHHQPQHNGSFTISWSKLFLTLDNGKSHNGKPIKDVLPCFIDKHSFLPLLTCFHDADKVTLNLTSSAGCITNTENNLTSL